MTNTVKWVNTILYIFLSFFILFETFIGRSVLGGLVSLRTISLYLLFVECLIFRVTDKRLLIGKSLIIFIILYTLIGLFHFSFINKNFKLFLYGYHFIVFFFIYRNMSILSYFDGSSFKRLLIIFAVLFIIINTLSYWIDIPLWERDINSGRMTRGYTTQDSVTLSYCLLMVLLDKEMRYKPKTILLLTLFLVLGIIIQASGTGTICMFFVLFSTLIVTFSSNSKLKHIRKVVYTTIVVVIVAFISLLSYIENEYPGLIDTLENRYYVLIGDDSNYGNINTLEIREEEFSSAKTKYLKNDIDKLMGVGFSNLQSGSNENGDIYIESQYYLNIITIGYVGASFFTIFLFFSVLSVFKLKETDQKVMYFCSIVLFCLSCRTINPLLTFPIYAIFLLFYTELRNNLCKIR